MAHPRKSIRLGVKATPNRRRSRARLSDTLRIAQDRTRARVNRPAHRRGQKWVRAAIAAGEIDLEAPPLPLRALRWLAGLILAPLAMVTSWTFFNLFSAAALDQQFWASAPFWYFATGALLMVAWFASGLLWNGFLYLYVLGHELTHIVFIRLCRGSVSEWGASIHGGYVTTDKTNILIALAPYFVPLWAAVTALAYVGVGCFVDLTPGAMKSLYFLLGFGWAFHLLWTLWMIPRDQPDLRENGTFLSLIIIYLGNLAVLVSLVCLASPEVSFGGFVRQWFGNARESIATAAELWLRLRMLLGPMW